ncbi:MAG: hypothetical protein ABR543_12000, partial [Gemmatimonadaceae bacterium]
MSGILGIFPTASTPPEEPVARRMLQAMESRGADRIEVWRSEAVLLAAARYEWELDPSFSGPVLIAGDEPLRLVADASLYYRSDLRRQLKAARIEPADDTASALIIAAYRAWGEKCAERLEGDFAFILHDAEAGRVVCARSFSGKRPLYYAEPSGS